MFQQINERKNTDAVDVPQPESDVGKVSTQNQGTIMRMNDNSSGDQGISMNSSSPYISMMENETETNETQTENITSDEKSFTPGNNEQVLLDVRTREKISIDEPMAKLVSEAFKPYLEIIIKNSNPAESESKTVSTQSIPKWRENIKTNLDKLVKTQAVDHGENKIYSIQQTEYEKRTKSIEELEKEKTDLKGKQKTDKNTIKTQSEKKMLSELKPDEIKKWWQLFKSKTQKQKDIETDEKKQIENLKSKTKTEEAFLKLLIQYLNQGVQKDVDINEVLKDTPQYKKHFDVKNQDKSLSSLKGILEGDVDKYSRDTKPGDFEPYKEFKIVDKDGKTIYYEFRGVNSIDDIMPIFAPKAQENVIEASRNDNASENPYRKLYDAGQQIPANGADLNNYLFRAGVATIPDAGTLYPDQNSIQKYLFSLDRDKRAYYLNTYRKGKYDETVTAFTATERETMKTEKREWETNQTRDTRNDLNTMYTAAYGLNITEDAWMKAHSKDMKDNPEQTESGYNKQGEATFKTANDFIEWLKKFPPSQLKWEGSELVPAMEKPVQGSDYDDFKRKDDEYILVKERARVWNLRVKGITEGTLKPKGWELDEWKQDALVNLSLNLINPQKWQSGAEQNDDREKARQKGGLPVDNPPLTTTIDKTLNSQNQPLNMANTSSIVQSGVYRINDQVRDPKYDETTGYLSNPNDQNYLRGFNSQNPLFSDLDRTMFEVKNSEQVSDIFDVQEKINWLINYKVQAYEEH